VGVTIEHRKVLAKERLRSGGMWGTTKNKRTATV